MRFKMAFETEDSSRISWFMGCISSVQVADALCWPDSPWRILQVTWDEPDLLQNVKCVSPWLVELVSNMPSVHLSLFSPPRKKPRLLQHPDLPSDGQLPMPTFSGNPFRCLPNTSSAGIQGAKHAQYGLSLSDLHFNKLQSGLFPDCFRSFDHRATTKRISNGGLIAQKPNMCDNVSCVLTIAHSTENSTKTVDAKKPQLVLFGQPILTEQQISRGCSGDAASPILSTFIGSFSFMVELFIT